ncbi:8936_t:CDS:2 [Racocetra persica]|uniref:8936_t:CDS:1 n=1 Tax=Racocetra persica TaxID=160502 RepID=A0ACA9Q777_9GLOM|nr:8936_t:CDS:2 [Racocetra persica]
MDEINLDSDSEKEFNESASSNNNNKHTLESSDMNSNNSSKRQCLLQNIKGKNYNKTSAKDIYFNAKLKSFQVEQERIEVEKDNTKDRKQQQNCLIIELIHQNKSFSEIKEMLDFFNNL